MFSHPMFPSVVYNFKYSTCAQNQLKVLILFFFFFQNAVQIVYVEVIIFGFSFVKTSWVINVFSWKQTQVMVGHQNIILPEMSY